MERIRVAWISGDAEPCFAKTEAGLAVKIAYTRLYVAEIDWLAAMRSGNMREFAYADASAEEGADRLRTAMLSGGHTKEEAAEIIERARENAGRYFNAHWNRREARP